jgi:hypothetical protein
MVKLELIFVFPESWGKESAVLPVSDRDRSPVAALPTAEAHSQPLRAPVTANVLRPETGRGPVAHTRTLRTEVRAPLNTLL